MQSPLQSLSSVRAQKSAFWAVVRPMVERHRRHRTTRMADVEVKLHQAREKDRWTWMAVKWRRTFAL